MGLLILTAIFAGISALGWVLIGIFLLVDALYYLPKPGSRESKWKKEWEEFDFVCPTCGEQYLLHPKVIFCSKDGARIQQVPKRRCPEGHLVTRHDKFCRECGAFLSQEGPMQPRNRECGSPLLHSHFSLILSQALAIAPAQLESEFFQIPIF